MAILKSSSGYSYDTETGVRTNPDNTTVKLDKLTGKPIPLSSLEQTTPMNLPEEKQTLNPTITLTPLEAETKRIEDAASQSQSDYKKLLEDIGLAEARQGEYAEELGATENRLAYKDYENKLALEKRAFETQRRSLMENPGGMSQAGLMGTISDLEDKSLQRQADISILGNMALGKYNEAISIAKDKVELELKPLTRQLEYYKMVMEDNKELLSVSQRAKLESLYADVKAEEDKERTRLTEGNEMIINAIQGKAPQATIQKAKDLLAQGKSKTEIAGVLGNYGMSVSDRLDNQIKQAQLNKLIAPEKSELNELLSIKEAQDAGVPYGTTKGQLISQGGKVTNQQEILTLQDKLGNIESLINHKGLPNAVGTTALGRKAPFQIGQKQDFIAGVEQLVSRDTLDTLVNLKKAGGTLGALSDQERIMLQSAASKIGTWRQLKDGNVTGYKASESSFKKELETLKMLTQRALTEAGGDITDNYLNVLDGALQVNPYLQAGYEL